MTFMPGRCHFSGPSHYTRPWNIHFQTFNHQALQVFHPETSVLSASLYYRKHKCSSVVWILRYFRVIFSCNITTCYIRSHCRKVYICKTVGSKWVYNKTCSFGQNSSIQGSTRDQMVHTESKWFNIKPTCIYFG